MISGKLPCPATGLTECPVHMLFHPAFLVTNSREIWSNSYPIRKNTRMFNGYVVWIESAVLSVSVLHHKACKTNWTASSEFGTYRLCEQQRFRRACASAQSHQNLRCSLIQAVSQEEPSDRKPAPWPLWMAGHAQLKFVMTECSKTQIRLMGLNFKLAPNSHYNGLFFLYTLFLGEFY